MAGASGLFPMVSSSKPLSEKIVAFVVVFTTLMPAETGLIVPATMSNAIPQFFESDAMLRNVCFMIVSSI